jgi:spore maturation protein CgeD
MPKVSCILTSYNQPKWLDQAIRSVLGQTYQDFELFVMDDNSSDKRVLHILKKYLSHPKVYIYRSQVSPEDRMLTCRYSLLINNALRLSSGDYITYLTDDDWYYPYRFSMMVDKLESDQDIHVVFGYQELTVGDDKPHGIRPSPTSQINDAYDIIDHNSVMHCRHIYDEIGDWTESPIHWRGADGQYWTKITDAGYLFWPVSSEVIPTEFHRFHSGSVRYKLLQKGMTDLN